jgi:hypothetical protein
MQEIRHLRTHKPRALSLKTAGDPASTKGEKNLRLEGSLECHVFDCHSRRI